MTLRESLQDALGDDIDVDALVKQLADLYEALDLPASPFDPTSIEGALTALGDVDPKNVGELIEAAFHVAVAAFDAIPGAGASAASLRTALVALETAGGSMATAVDGLRGSWLAASPDVVPGERVAGAMGGLAAFAQADVATLLRELVPVPAVDDGLGSVRDVLAASEGLPRLTDGVRSLMELAAGIAQGLALREAIASLPDGAAIADLRQQVGAWDPSTTVARITSGDAADAIVADVAPALQRITDLEHALADLLAGTGSILRTLDLDPVLATWRRVDAGLATLDARPVHDLVAALVAGLEGPMRARPSDAVPTPDAFATEVAALLDRLTTAIGAVAVDTIGQGIQAGVTQATAPLHDASQALAAVRTAVLDAHEAVEHVLDAVDLQRVAEGIRLVTEPTTAALGEIRAALAAVSAEIGVAVQAAVQAIGELQTAIDAIAGTLTTAFQAVAQALDGVDLAGKLEQVQAALQPIADTLNEVQIGQAANAAADGISRVASVIDALPLELLPDSARSELDTVTGPIKSFDFDTEIRQKVADQIAAIEDAIDTEVLDQVRQAQAQAAEFITSIDPRPPVEAFERDSFTPALDKVRTFDPDQQLAPMRDAIAAVPDLSRLLDPADAQFDALMARFDELAPRALLEPVAAPLRAARTQAIEQLHLDAIEAQVSAARDAASSTIDAVSVTRWIDALAELAEASLPAPGPAHGSEIGQVVIRLTGAAESLDSGSFAVVADWLSGRSAVDVAGDALGQLRAELIALRDAIGALDPAPILGELQPGYRAVADAIGTLPGGALRRRLRLLLPPPPSSLADDYARARGDVMPAITGQLTLAAQMAALDLRGTRHATTALAEALAPLATVRDWMLDWVRRTGAAVDPNDLAGSAREALVSLRAQLATGAGAKLEAQVRTTLRSALEAVVNAIRDAVTAVRAVIAALDLEPLIVELEQFHAAKRADLARFRPTTQLADVATALTTLEHDLRTFDPLADIRPALDAFRGAVGTVETRLRPSVLLAPAIDAFQRTAATLTKADVDQLFGPLLNALKRITDDVDNGLDDIGTAFGRLQAALP
jgi:hypothetical protein